MEYSESYISSKDIDWFFKMNNRYVHVASAGGKLPGIINDREKLRQVQYEVYNLPYIFSVEEIRINQGFIMSASPFCQLPLFRTDYKRTKSQLKNVIFFKIQLSYAFLSVFEEVLSRAVEERHRLSCP